MGRILGIVGGKLTVVGVFLPWVSVTYSGQTVSAWGIQLWFIGLPILVLIFGIIGLVLVAKGRRGTAIGGLVMGILAFIFAIVSVFLLAIVAEVISGVSDFEIGIDFGLYLTLVGAIILIVGSGLTFSQAGKAAPVAPIEPMPPMEE